MKISRATATSMIRGSGGKVFGVSFVKRTDGTVRTMSARTQVRKHLTGEGLKFSPTQYNLSTVFDMNKQAYRMVNLEGLTSLTMEGGKYEVE